MKQWIEVEEEGRDSATPTPFFTLYNDPRRARAVAKESVAASEDGSPKTFLSLAR